MILGCGHPDAAYGATTCVHLVERGARWVKYYRWLTGVGLESELLCPLCVAEREAGREVVTSGICTECREWLEDEVGDMSGVRGRPEIRERKEGIANTTIQIPFPESFGAVLDLAPVTRRPSMWLLLSTDGKIASLDLSSEDWRDLGAVDLQPEPDHKPWVNHLLTPRLHVSPAGDFFAVVNDYGKKGAVYRVGSSTPTITLNGGAYHPETVPFSFMFTEHRGRSVAIHRTAWNRLDASDAATGKLLTDRAPTSYRHGEERPTHYLDYFHGRLTLSPDGHRVVDDGWVWHPVGIPEIWDVNLWLDNNAWESEDGTSKISLAARAYYWDHALCWVGPKHVALGGIGDDDDHIFDGARLFAVDEIVPSPRTSWRTPREVGTFAGPSGQFFSDGHRLFSSAEDGLSVWDINVGARIGRIDGFRPTRQHPAGGELVEVTGSVLLRWPY